VAAKPALDPTLEAKIGKILAAMSIEDKVGQTIQADIATLKPEDLKTYKLGSVLNGGNSAPNSAKPDAAIVVFGETPYAEFMGDRPTLEYSPGDKNDVALLRKLKAAGIPVVAVFLSGRPMWVNAELNASDAFVAAFLPGSEGAGVADVLFAGKEGHRAARHLYCGETDALDLRRSSGACRWTGRSLPEPLR
jgi:hypothetical protein